MNHPATRELVRRFLATGGFTDGGADTGGA